MEIKEFISRLDPRRTGPILREVLDGTPDEQTAIAAMRESREKETNEFPAVVKRDLNAIASDTGRLAFVSPERSQALHTNAHQETANFAAITIPNDIPRSAA